MNVSGYYFQLLLRPNKKIYLFSVPARPENCPRPQFFLFFIFVKYNFSGVNKCVFKYTCAQDRPFSFPCPSKYAWNFCALYWRHFHVILNARRLKVGTVEKAFVIGTLRYRYYRLRTTVGRGRTISRALGRLQSRRRENTKLRWPTTDNRLRHFDYYCYVQNVFPKSSTFAYL